MPTTKKPRRLVYMRLADIAPADVNPKDHDEPGIGASMDRFGFIESMVLDERTSKLVGGHGRRDRLLAGEAEGSEPPEGVLVDDAGFWIAPVTRGWRSANDAEAIAAGIALNRIGERGGWIVPDLERELRALSETERGLDGLGFTLADLDNLPALLVPAGLDPDDAEPKAAPSTGDLLALVDVTIGEPTVQVETGDVWTLGDHVLVCADVMTGHALWAPHLGEGVVFCPYPGPFMLLTGRADKLRLLLVQPDAYIAGHIIDKWQSVHLKATPEKAA